MRFKFLQPAKNRRKLSAQSAGFTLIEIMVAASIFIVVMVISSGSILSVYDLNRRSQNLRAVMDNLNLTLTAMSRTIRFGTKYHCDASVLPLATPRDCASGASSFSVLTSGGAQLIYSTTSVATTIKRSLDGGTSFSSLTSPEVTITNLRFYVFGSAPYNQAAATHDLLQPRVIIVVSGYVGAKSTSKSTFSLQTTISQRAVDSQ